MISAMSAVGILIYTSLHCQIGENQIQGLRIAPLTSTDSERPVGKLSPFAIHKGILGIAGVVKDLKKLRSGDILVECAKRAQPKTCATCYNVGRCWHEGLSSLVSEL